jgi:hypothetical protein
MILKYFTLLLLMFLLKSQPLNLKHPQIRYKNSQAKSVIKIPVFKRVKKGKHIQKVLLGKLSGLQCLQPGPQPSWPSFPPPAVAVPQPALIAWVMEQAARFSLLA